MQHVTALDALRLDRPTSLTIGAFDGVHRGHQALIAALVERAHQLQRAAVVVTFYPHPSVVLRGRRPSFYISSPEQKLEQLQALGVDAVVTHPFNRAVASVRAGEFVERLLIHARMAELWCGADFALGHNREGTVDFLRAEGDRRNFTIHVVEPILFDGEVISSTRIRQALRDGAVEQVTRYLGRPFQLTGEVVEGAKRGRTIGIPTANLAVHDERAIPATGVYAVRARVNGQVYSAVTNIGYRPTFENGEAKPTIEAHLLDFAGDVYGQTLAFDFVARLRPEMKFAGVNALLEQIQRDITTAKQLLGEQNSEVCAE